MLTTHDEFLCHQTVDTFACFVVDGKTQYCIRASRELRSGFDQIRVGPLSYEVTAPLRCVQPGEAPRATLVFVDSRTDSGWDRNIEHMSFPLMRESL